MLELQTLLLFVSAALIVALTPGPGIFYIVARTLAGGRSEGLASSVGLGLGGLVHVFAGAVGLSALMMASAEAFTALKIAGAFYLIWLGIKTWREARVTQPAEVTPTGSRRAFREGIIVEALNPKTAAFFLAFIPQFVDPAGHVGAQFVVLGLISVTLNTSVDLVVTFWAAKARHRLAHRPSLVTRMRQASGAVMCSLGGALLLARRTS
ncbi:MULTISPECIES: LysE family translocator [unclassified Bradyrhizobium]|uniref:LysE family translocator n=1 Tax=unclassified Bradyrhizobium TaxID=2631580 RepID=UPI0028E37091|nr:MULTISPECIES: LysE family translocator [unclassified Bradyrhizobium]